MTPDPGEPEPDLAEAYALETPDDNRDLYRRWAASYEQGFAARRGYVYPAEVAQLFVARGGTGPVLDVGCGTGLVGEALRRLGVAPVDGVDISPEMLAEAAGKVGADGAPLYRELIEADLTQPVELPDASYAGLVSAGTFTHGHLGPEVLGELYRLAAPGARAAIGVSEGHYRSHGFEAHFAAAHEAALISAPEAVEVPVYEGGDDEHAGDVALVVVFTIVSAQNSES